MDLPLLRGADVGKQFLILGPDLIQVIATGAIGIEDNSWHALVLGFLAVA